MAAAASCSAAMAGDGDGAGGVSGSVMPVSTGTELVLVDDVVTVAGRSGPRLSPPAELVAR